VSDISGRLVRDLGSFAPGVSITWDGTDAAGRRAAPGLYLVTATSSRVTATGRVMLVE
jgi:hypothetical protein